MESFYNLLSSTTFLTILAAWIIYRVGVWNERNNILEGIKKEIDLHKSWVGNPYYDGVIPQNSNWHHKNYVVFKLSTVAIDNAIEKGPGIFLNNNLLNQLIGYRQQINQFNQLIDVAMMFQSNSELWKSKPDKSLELRMVEVTEQIHWYGINNSNKPFAYRYFKSVTKELKLERESKVLPIIWLLLNINLFSIKRGIIKFL